MSAECRCVRDRGSCCVGCRAVMELMAISVRLALTAPDCAAQLKKLAVELQCDLVEDRRVKGEFERL